MEGKEPAKVSDLYEDEYLYWEESYRVENNFRVGRRGSVQSRKEFEVLQNKIWTEKIAEVSSKGKTVVSRKQSRKFN